MNKPKGLALLIALLRTLVVTLVVLMISFFMVSYSPINGLDAFFWRKFNAMAPLFKPHPFGIKTVVIDAGHGGKDPGCLGTKYKEKDAALGIALKLGKYIESKIPDVKVVYTRKSDVFLELDERAAIANKNKADLFICIHANASENKNAHGSETYVMGLHKSNANLNVAKRENASILLEKNYSKKYDGFDPNSETGYILLTMQQNAYLKQSLNFASKIQKNIREKVGTVDKGVQQAGFLVLWRTAMPSVLIETEFLTNPEAEKLLSSEKGQDAFARAIFLAFRQYKDEVEGKLAKYEDEIETAPPIEHRKDSVEQKGNGGKEGNEGNGGKPEKEGNEGKVIVPKKDSVTLKNDPVKQPPVKDSIVPVKPLKDSTSVIVPAKKDTVTPVKTNSPTPGGVIVYKVQFLSSSQRIPLVSDKFKGLKDIGEYQDGAMFKYTAGEFKTLEDAMKYRTEMQNKGHKDCFVVKFKDGVRWKN